MTDASLPSRSHQANSQAGHMQTSPRLRTHGSRGGEGRRRGARSLPHLLSPGFFSLSCVRTVLFSARPAGRVDSGREAGDGKNGGSTQGREAGRPVWRPTAASTYVAAREAVPGQTVVLGLSRDGTTSGKPLCPPNCSRGSLLCAPTPPGSLCQGADCTLL